MRWFIFMKQERLDGVLNILFSVLNYLCCQLWLILQEFSSHDWSQVSIKLDSKYYMSPLSQFHQFNHKVCHSRTHQMLYSWLQVLEPVFRWCTICYDFDSVFNHFQCCLYNLISVYTSINITFNIISVIVTLPTLSRYGASTFESYITGTWYPSHPVTFYNWQQVHWLYFLGLTFECQMLGKRAPSTILES